MAQVPLSENLFVIENQLQEEALRPNELFKNYHKQGAGLNSPSCTGLLPPQRKSIR